MVLLLSAFNLLPLLGSHLSWYCFSSLISSCIIELSDKLQQLSQKLTGLFRDSTVQYLAKGLLLNGSPWLVFVVFNSTILSLKIGPILLSSTISCAFIDSCSLLILLHSTSLRHVAADDDDQFAALSYIPLVAILP